MEFHKQLEVERKKAGLTLKKLAQIITENTGNIITSDRLRNWELGISDIDISSLSYLCKLYNISADNFLDCEVEPDLDLKQQYYQFGKQINDCCQVYNIFEFLKVYDIAEFKDWFFVPKYDIIARTYEDNLKEDGIEDIELYRCKAALDNLTFWMIDNLLDKEGTPEDVNEILYIDRSGKLSVTDTRDPVNIQQVMVEIESLSTDLISMLQDSVFEEKGVDLWQYI
ncbi:helix-turn-helix transcriptional regulator [Listeria monocytogenes]|uniref:XRE family transcriptional regulator n=1 Tax=Listeria monocytogenes serotype 1/2a TaxID=1906951 RepID=A0A9P2DMS0_LISMN|nr:XRE family transcriptional regulator [Listeria monocytogenes]EAE6066329.1 XRE family transcriptional regulator [Listeria monocytogenes serotype 1/2a]EAE5899679.1 XRE family transcriptional regulator [Listeria monocytogenes]EAE5912477.1 XRE family transcriptional regulator [Listeria monocytogenes]EHK9315678.1 helix-turn-helix transcriptional regulator [Listeria monocytogenes]